MPLSIKLDLLYRNTFAEEGKYLLIYGDFHLKINHDYFDHFSIFCAMLKMLKILLISDDLLNELLKFR